MRTDNIPKLTRKEKIAQNLEKLPGNRKARSAELIRQSKENEAKAHLREVSSSPRKMRLVADMVRGRKVNEALAILKVTNKFAAAPLHKLIRSAVDNFVQKFPDNTGEIDQLVIAQIYVGCGRMLKRLRPAPQGRANRVRKRSNHVTVELALISDFEGNDN